MKSNSKLSKLVEINKGFRKGSSFSPALFNIYLDELISKWEKEDTEGIPFLKNQQLLRCYLLKNTV